MRWTLVASVFTLVLAGCGGGAAEPEAAPTAPATLGPTATATPEEPEELALVESDLLLEGDTGVLVTPGETVVVDHLLRNEAVTARSVGLRVSTEDDIEVELSFESKRVARESTELLQSTLTVPDDVSVGDVLTYEVIVLNVNDIEERAATTVQLLVTDAVGSRPVVGADAGSTATNERVLIWAIGDDSDPDDDLDPSSVRVIAGGWLADQIIGADGAITYVPFANVEGDDMLLYEVCDAESRCGTGVITVSIG